MALDPRLWQWLVQDSRRYGLDPRAVAAIAMNESGGRLNAVGDSGTSFGAFQLHQGGALPAGRGLSWAASRVGVDYALRQMSTVARGLHGAAAIRNIAYRFERPANPGAEAAVAMRYYSQPGFARGGTGGAPLAGGGSGSPPMRGPTGNPAAALAALGLMGGGSLHIPTRAYPTALESIQQFIQAHQPATPAVSAPLAPAVPNPTAAPSPQALAGQLDTLHQGLLNHL